DSPMGLRLPLDSLPWVVDKDYPYIYQPDPMEQRPPLPRRQSYARGDFAPGQYRREQPAEAATPPVPGQSDPSVVRTTL
ncbi:transglutaminase family protein, partial [Acinetobacter baumannii]